MLKQPESRPRRASVSTSRSRSSGSFSETVVTFRKVIRPAADRDTTVAGTPRHQGRSLVARLLGPEECKEAAGPRMLDALCATAQHNCARRMTNANLAQPDRGTLSPNQYAGPGDALL